MICFLAIILNLISNISIYLLLPTAGITMAASTRKMPNCFNFLRQLEILGRAGHDGSAGAFNAHALVLLFELVKSESCLHSCFGVKRFFRVPEASISTVARNGTTTPGLPRLSKSAPEKLQPYPICKRGCALLWSNACGRTCGHVA